MPWKKGVATPGAGRKGYQIELNELKKMTSLFRRYLTLAEIIESGKATDNQKDAFERLRPLVLKIMDKLHANKEAKKEVDITSQGEKITGINYIIPNGDNLKTNN